MKSIYYCSSMQLDKHPQNSRSKFSSSIDISTLDYIANGPIEVGIKSVMMDVNIKSHFMQSLPTTPDVVIVQNLANESYELLDMNLSPTNAIIPFDEKDAIDKWITMNKGTAYVVDERESRNELDMKFFCIPNYHENVTSINFLFDSNQQSGQVLLQLLFIQNCEFSTTIEFDALVRNILKNALFKAKLDAESKIYAGEQISKYVSTEPGNSKRKVKILSEFVADAKLENLNDLSENILYKIVNYNYLHVVTSEQFTADHKLLKFNMLGLRSNISRYSIRNNNFDQVVATWHIDSSSSGLKKIDFENPVFFETSKEKLASANFEIFSILEEKQPNFGIGVPTFVHCVVRRMLDAKPFSIMIDSSCPKSKLLYANNNPMDFKIELPERLSFPNEWSVSLKSLFLPNSLYNISTNNYYFKYYEKVPQKEFKSSWFDKVPHYAPSVSSKEVKMVETTKTITPPRYNVKDFKYYEYESNEKFLPKGCYKTLSDLCREINQSWEKYNVRLLMETKNENFIKITLHTDVTGGEFKIQFSPYLAFILGLSNDISKPFDHDFSDLTEFATSVSPKLDLLIPKYIIVCCDIVDDTIFSGQHVKLLRMLVNTEESTSQLQLMSFDFLTPEFIDLKIRDFSNIQIMLTDVSGNPLITDSILPTQLQLIFKPN